MITAGTRRPDASIRVVFISDVQGGRNGVGTYYQDLVDHLENRVGAVELMCPSPKYRVFNHRLAVPVPGDTSQRLYLPKVFKIFQRIKAIQPQVIIIPTPGPFGWCGYFIAKHLGIHTCIGYHTQFEELAALYWNRVFGGMGHRLINGLNHLLFKDGAMVVANHDDIVQTAAKAGARRTKLMGTTIAKRFFQHPPPPVSPRLKTIMFAGRLAPEKNVDWILDAAEKLPRYHFVIAGDGPLRKRVQQCSARLSNLHYLGWVSRKKLMIHLDHSDLLVLPSRLETFGTIAMEAMARKRLVLVSGYCGILSWPLLARGLFEIKRHEKLTDAIQRIDTLSEKRKTEKVEQGFEAVRLLNENTINRWMETFNEIIDDASGSR